MLENYEKFLIAKALVKHDIKLQNQEKSNQISSYLGNLGLNQNLDPNYNFALNHKKSLASMTEEEFNRVVESINLESFEEIKKLEIDFYDPFDPDNAYDYCINYKKFQRSTKGQRLRLFLYYIKKAIHDPYKSYSYPIGAIYPPKIKHLVTQEEIKGFNNYLINKQFVVTFIMIEILNKFGFRVKAIAP